MKLTKIFILFSVLIFSVITNTCMTSIAKFKNIFQTTLSSNNYNTQIDQLALLLKQLPTILDNCGQKQYADSFRKQVPNPCIDNLAQASKLGKKILDQKDNKAKAAIDTILFQRLIDKKVKKTCPFLVDLDLKKITDPATCYQSVYDYSLLLQKIQEDHLNSNTIPDVVNAIEKLPDTLDKCGQNQLADTIRNDFPQDCLKSIGVLGQLLIEFEHKFDRVNWILYHLKQFNKDYNQVVYTCPLFGDKGKQRRI